MPADKKRFFPQLLILSVLVLAVPAFQGCTLSQAPGKPAPEHLSKNYGQSYEALLCVQAVNPDASKDAAPVDALPGQAGDSIYENYLNSFDKNADSDDFMNMLNGL